MLLVALEHCKLQLKKVYVIYFSQFSQFKEKHVYYNNNFSQISDFELPMIIFTYLAIIE